MKRIKIQCGWEDDCKSKDCLNCRRRMKFKNLNLTLAEAICIEDFGDCDMESMVKGKSKELELMQNVMRKLDKRVFWK